MLLAVFASAATNHVVAERLRLYPGSSIPVSVIANEPYSDFCWLVKQSALFSYSLATIIGGI
jgi:hypothetical protein